MTMIVLPGQRWRHKRLPSCVGVITDIRLDPDGQVVVDFAVDHTPDNDLCPTFKWDSWSRFHNTMEFVESTRPVKKDLSRYPHSCPRCSQAAYVGAGGGAAVDCTNVECPTRKR